MNGLSIPVVLERIRAVSLPFGVVLAAAAPGRTLDCNGNSVEDSADIAAGSSGDCNSNRIPDECDILGHPLAFRESSFFTTARPVAMTEGDIDGDGDAELAVAGDGRTAILVLERVADTLMETEILLPALATALLAADLDRDGDLDLAAVVGFSVVVLRNDADAFTLAPGSIVGSNPRAIAAGDMDGDGDPDLMTANSHGDAQPGNVAVFRNDGAGNLGIARFYAAQVDPGALTLQDSDGDGDLDAAVANHGSSSVSLLLNDGSGVFPGAAHRRVPLGFTPDTLAAADLDGDGRIDLAVKALDSEILLILENSGGGGEYSDSARIDVKTAGGKVLAEDLDRDGDPDLVVGSSAVTLLENAGDGALLPVRIGPVGPIPLQPAAILSIDFDSDGDRDLALGTKHPWGGVIILGNHGRGAFDAVEYPLPRTPESLLVHDLDGDGDVDVLAADSEYYERGGGGPGESVDLLRNDGRGRLELSSTFRLDRGPAGMAAGDVDGDGDTDVAVALQGYREAGGEKVAFLIQEGPGSFVAGKELPVECCPAELDLADLDEDGDLDLVVRFDLFVYWYLNDGLGGFSLLSGAFPGGWTTVLARDLNGDGHVDVFCLAPPALHVFWNDGSANFVWSRFESGESTHLACADLDHDGDLDVGLGFRSSGHTPPHVLWNDGAGVFRESIALDFDGRAYSVAAADLDADGGAELLALSNLTNKASVYRARGPALLERTEELVLMPARETVTQGVMALGDMDSDGDADLVLGTLDGILIVRNRFEPGSSPDSDADGIPDECGEETPFLRGDVDASGLIDISDAIAILGGLFLGKREHLACERSADADDTGVVDLTDAVFLLGHLFLGGAPPPQPHPLCGLDPSPDGLSCASRPACE